MEWNGKQGTGAKWNRAESRGLERIEKHRTGPERQDWTVEDWSEVEGTVAETIGEAG